MQWPKICEHYPQQWLLIEAIQAHSEANKRYLDQLAVVDAFAESSAALNAYSQLHHETPQRELYVFHTSRKTLDITEQQWLGIRSSL